MRTGSRRDHERHCSIRGRQRESGPAGFDMERSGRDHKIMPLAIEKMQGPCEFDLGSRYLSLCGDDETEDDESQHDHAGRPPLSHRLYHLSGYRLFRAS
jgi:hypothetical protein